MDINLKKLVLLELLKPSRESLAYSSSSSSSSSDEESDDKTSSAANHVRDINYLATIARNYSSTDFKHHFRMERSTIEVLLELYGVDSARWHGGWPRVSREKAVLLTIWYLANKETFRQIADRFKVTLSCVHNIVKNVTEFLVKTSSKYIKWPNAASAQQGSVIFEHKKGLQNVLGAIGATHFRMNKPKSRQEDYLNNKGFYSVIMQGVVNSSMEFINIHVGEPGSMHESRVLKRSAIYKKCKEKSDKLFYGKFKLLGDSNYLSLPWLLTPLLDNGHLSDADKTFNYTHSSSRIIIENGFGHLKGRFRRLQKFDNFSVGFIVNCIVASCVLHNICQTADDQADEIFFDEEIDY